ncbi:hypothetical protein HanXRQr2_Chr10g0446471 [Helianthus annuus]|uniref:Uncharacterized protein n=1 Tax=Helianthus annuus TaxID=4232 RepID=A0A9K3HYL3_HELAN|nr:hypothetical protein HanXRQr2_Chr10g0446471 [Helianthus annuus]
MRFRTRTLPSSLSPSRSVVLTCTGANGAPITPSNNLKSDLCL